MKNAVAVVVAATSKSVLSRGRVIIPHLNEWRERVLKLKGRRRGKPALIFCWLTAPSCRLRSILLNSIFLDESLCDGSDGAGGVKQFTVGFGFHCSSCKFPVVRELWRRPPPSRAEEPRTAWPKKACKRMAELSVLHRHRTGR